MEARGRVGSRDITFKPSPGYLVSLGARSLLVRERGVSEVGNSRCCQGFGTWSPSSRSKTSCGDSLQHSEQYPSLPSRAGSVIGDVWPSLAFGVSAGTSWRLSPELQEGRAADQSPHRHRWCLHKHPASHRLFPPSDCSTGTPGMGLTYWSFFCCFFFISLGIFEKQCIFWVVTGSLFWCVQEAEKLISFSWWLGQGVSHLPLPQRAYQEFAWLLILSAWHEVGTCVCYFIFLSARMANPHIKASSVSLLRVLALTRAQDPLYQFFMQHLGSVLRVYNSKIWV